MPLRPRLALRFSTQPPPAIRATAGRLLGVDDPGPDCRWLAPNLLTARPLTPPAPAAMAELRSLPGLTDLVDRSRTPPPPAPDALELIAGPCSVESATQIEAAAAAVAAHGATALRGGAFKPRTSPYAFGGLGVAGLELLAAAGRRHGLPVVTEVLDAADLDLVAAHADVLQIGSRNMHNASLLFEAGRHHRGRPILLKRGMAATIDETAAAAEYVWLGRLAAGHREPGLRLCERGVRGFDPTTRFMLDIAAIPLLQASAGVPVFADPSHAAGRADLVAPLACAAIAAGANGLLVEVHPEPARSFSDAAQSLAPPAFGELVRRVQAIHEARTAAVGEEA